MQLRASIEAGDINASAAMRYRVEGALVPLEVLRGAEVPAIIERPTAEPLPGEQP